MTGHSERRDCRVYWGHSGCDLERGHEGDHADASGNRVTVHDAYLFGEDLTDEERRLVKELWD